MKNDESWIKFKNDNYQSNIINDEFYLYPLGSDFLDYYLTFYSDIYIDQFYIKYNDILINYKYGYIYFTKSVNDKVSYFDIFSFTIQNCIFIKNQSYSQHGLLDDIKLLKFLEYSLWEEETYHVIQFLFHNDFYKRFKFQLNNKININYYFSIIEIDAKLKKTLFPFMVINLDCDKAWEFFCKYRIHIATRKLRLNNIKFDNNEKKEALSLLLNNESIQSDNIVYNTALSVTGTIIRKPYSQKIIFTLF